jgi:hypothetical protein
LIRVLVFRLSGLVLLRPRHLRASRKQ